MSFKNSINSLPVIQWINESWIDHPYKDYFISFSKLYKLFLKAKL